jgi:hypothetical protein
MIRIIGMPGSSKTILEESYVSIHRKGEGRKDPWIVILRIVWIPRNVKMVRIIRMVGSPKQFRRSGMLGMPRNTRNTVRSCRPKTGPNRIVQEYDLTASDQFYEAVREKQSPKKWDYY